jgi:PhnB protein
MNTVPHQAPGFHAITPSLTIKGCAAAMEFYKKAFGASEVSRMASPDGTVMHAEMKFGDSTVMMSDEFPDWDCLSPQTVGGTATTLMFYVPDVDAVFGQAIAAGATAMNKPTDQFWGDRSGCVIDPYGHKWTVATHKENLSDEEIGRRAAEWMKQQKG